MIEVVAIRVANAALFGANFIVDWIQRLQVGIVEGKEVPPLNWGNPRSTLREERIAASPAILYCHLGRTVQLVKHDRRRTVRSAPIRLRDPQEMIRQLDDFRQKNLAVMHRLYTDPQGQLQRMLANRISAAARRDFAEAEPDRRQLMQQSLVRSSAALLFLTNHVLLFLHHHYRFNPGIGWWQGRALEQTLYSQLLPARSKWNKNVREELASLEFPLPADVGAFARPAPDGPSTAARSAPAAPSSACSKIDAARLAFYLTLKNFVEFRVLHGPLNRYGYLAVILTDGRVILDTEVRENAIRGLSGKPLDDLLVIAQGTKADIDNSGCSPFWRAHDECGNWRNAVANWAN